MIILVSRQEELEYRRFVPVSPQLENCITVVGIRNYTYINKLIDINSTSGRMAISEILLGRRGSILAGRNQAFG